MDHDQTQEKEKTAPLSAGSLPIPQPEIVVASDGQKIHYDLYKNGHPHVIVIAHGFFNSKGSILLKELAYSLLDRYDVMIMDFRGHGQSPGLFTWTSKEYLDLTAVLEAGRAGYGKTGVVGFSLGAATSLITAARNDLMDTLIAISPPAEFEKIDFRWWELDVENDIFFNLTGDGRTGKGVRPGPFWIKKEKPLDAVKRIKAPVCYIHGSADWLIKPQHSQILYERTPGVKRLEIIDNGPHAEYLMRKHKAQTVGIVREWLAQTLNEEVP